MIASDRRGLYPFPTGWYCVATDRELESPVRTQACGRWLDLSLVGDRLVARADDGEPVHLTRQQDMAFVWHAPEGEPPAWPLPQRDPAGFTPFWSHCWRGVRTHPQETTENSVDLAHFSALHSFASVEVHREARANGPCLDAAYGIRRFLIPGLTRATMRIDFQLEAWGLGYSLVEAHTPAFGVKSRHLVLSTPTDDNHIDLRIAWSIERTGFGPVADWLALMGIRAIYVHEVGSDLHVWENKRYVVKPVVVDGDGPIHLYRRWALQFTPPEARIRG